MVVETSDAGDVCYVAKRVPVGSSGDEKAGGRMDFEIRLALSMCATLV